MFQHNVKNLFLDRDGIINEIILRGETISSPRSFYEFTIRKEFISFYESIKDLNLFVVSNQPDVTRRLMDYSVLEKINEKLFSLFNFREISYCIHDNTDQCKCRKPKPGMILTLLEKYELKKEKSLLIGDSYKDILAGNTAGVKTVLLKTNYNSKQECKPDYKVEHLEEVTSLFF
jgi:D-glycero-D-manno-heptose 1,7-bisphosphate phosphatase